MEDSVTKADLDQFRKFLLDELNNHKQSFSDQFAGASRSAETALALSKQIKCEGEFSFTHPGNERNFKFKNAVKGLVGKALHSLEGS